MQYHKTSNNRNTVWSSNSSDYHDNSNEPVQISIASHFPDAVNFLQVIPMNPFFVMRDNGSLGYWSRKISHSYSYRCNNNNKISEE